MGTDYFLINDTKREYIWLGRWDLGKTKPITINTLSALLDKSIIDEAIECIDYGVSLERNYYVYLYQRYKILSKYIKSNKCFCQSEYDAIPVGYCNNMDIENKLMDLEVPAVFNKEKCRLLK